MKIKVILISLFVITFLTSFQSAFAQWESVMETTYFSDGKLKTASQNTHYGAMEGSPYFYDKWAPGEARLSDGQTYKGLLLKYDQITETLMFKYNINDSIMVFQFQPLEFKIQYIANNIQLTANFVNGFDPVNGNDKRTFYQVLTNTGKIKVIKRIKKSINEIQSYSNGTRVSVVEQANYYTLDGNKPIKLKIDKKSILILLADKVDKVKQYMADNDIDVKDDMGLVKVINYYNNL